MTKESASKLFWNSVAAHDSAWYTATGFTAESDEFFQTGPRDVDALLQLNGVRPPTDGTLLEIGSGVGRMTRAFSERSANVIAADISSAMLDRAKSNLVGCDNVQFVELDGDGSIPLSTGSVDAVFSYITMQHVSSAAAQNRYLDEAIRVVRPGGWVVLQFRRTGVTARILDLRANVGNFVRGRKTLSSSWRGARIPESILRGKRTGDVSIDVLRSDNRHVWAVAKRSR